MVTFQIQFLLSDFFDFEWHTQLNFILKSQKQVNSVDIPPSIPEVASTKVSRLFENILTQ